MNQTSFNATVRAPRNTNTNLHFEISPNSAFKPFKNQSSFTEKFVEVIQKPTKTISKPKVPRKYRCIKDRVCKDCSVSTTIEWRRGPKETWLCNSCGLKLLRKRKKELSIQIKRDF